MTCLNCYFREIRVGNNFEIWCRLKGKQVKEVICQEECKHLTGGE